ncbi:MAG: hypothetical protein GYB68_00720 [Chloroflexi bacterium]|nr:hypothetical protein [Chloroflexota bacterium]
MNLTIRRILLVLISIALGIGSVFVLVAVMNAIWGAGAGNAPITLETYTTTYTVLTAAPMALFFAVWLDAFLSTGFLPERGQHDEE